MCWTISDKQADIKNEVDRYTPTLRAEDSCGVAISYDKLDDLFDLSLSAMSLLDSTMVPSGIIC